MLTFFSVLEWLWGNENGWGNVSEECCFNAFDVAAAMQTEHMCAHILAHVHTGTHTGVYGSKSWVWCVCVSGFEDEEKSQRAPGDVAYPMDREKEREEERERGAWHCSSLSDGSSSGLRHGLPLISLSLDMKLRREAERRVAEGTKQETFAGACARLIFTLYCFYFKAHNNTHLPADTHTVDCKNRNDELWLTIGMTFIWTGLVPTHESFIAFWSIDRACNKYIWPRASPSLNYTHIKIALMTPVLKSNSYETRCRPCSQERNLQRKHGPRRSMSWGPRTNTKLRYKCNTWFDLKSRGQ